ncbi:MAG: DNA polymerase III subunit beta [Clostridia bacterium]|nr:DNA polymerase III subunit beta [Clostridia bacterium]
MRIICNTSVLTQVCQNVQRCVPTRAVMPLLDGILMRTTDDGRIELCGYDLELGISTTFETRIEEEGASVINAKMLVDILRHLPDERMTLDINPKNICTIESGNVEYTLVGMNAAEYPELPKLGDENVITIPNKVLRSMILQTIFAVSVDEAKTVHRGVKFEFSPGELRLVALDGYRMAIRKEFVDYNGKVFSFIVPSKTLNEVVKLLNDDDEPVTIRLSKRHIIFSIGNYNIVSRLLEGEFIDYKSAVPTAKTTTVRVNTRELMDCIERTSVIVSEKTRSPLRFNFSDDSIRMSVVTALGSATDRMETSVTGKATEIGFNSRYVLDALRSCEADEVLIDLNGPVSPCLIVPTEGDHFMYLILPVRLK